MTQTQPSALAAPSLYLSNWHDLVALWQGRALSKITAWQTPGVRELHYVGGTPAQALVNQIVDWSGFFRDATGGYSYTDASNFDTAAWFESATAEAGVLTTTYLQYAGAAVQPRCTITRSYVAVPQQRLLVARYGLVNPTATDLTFNVLDQLHPSNHGGQPVHAWYDNNRRALFADVTASGQMVLALGVFEAMDGFQVGDESRSDGPQRSGWSSFDHDGTLPGNADLTAADVDLAFNRQLTVPGHGSAEMYVYLVIGPNLAGVEADVDAARARAGKDWFDQTAGEHASWLGPGVTPNFADDGLNEVFTRGLIVCKHAQNPGLGAFPATTNPIAYQYFSWMRDSALTAIALDSTGHHDEAAQYWRWMASVQNLNGTWRTRSSVWDGSESAFVAPEYDSVGQFLYGVSRHFAATGDQTFLADIWPAAKRAADFILSGISTANGLGAADKSIWEEEPAEHNAFTQAWYVAGLYAAQLLAEAQGNTGLADWYAGGPASIISAIQRRSDDQPPGLWNVNGYFNRAVTTENTPRPLADSSTTIVPMLGVVDADSGRAAAHVATMLRLLTRDSYGLARYPHDGYYFDKPYDPAGDEAGGAEPSWPQMTMWVAAYEALTGNQEGATERLQWFASTCGVGYMPQGEAVSNLTRQSVLSTMSEPLTAASFLIAALVCLGQSDPRLEPPIRQLGCRGTVPITAGAASDFDGWKPVPYVAIGGERRGTVPTSSIARCWVANDDSDLYVRVDNAAGDLPDYDVEPKFALRVYASDLAGNAATLSIGLDGRSLPRPVSFALERRSDQPSLRRWSAGDHWLDEGTAEVDLAPQWDPTSGTIEAKLPLSMLAGGAVQEGNVWAHVIVAVARHDPSSDSWLDDGRAVIHYRLTSPGTPPLFGNVDE